LLGGDLGKLGPAMPDVDVPQPGQGVEVPLTSAVDDLSALASDRHEWPGVIGRVGQRMNHVVPVDAQHLIDVNVSG